MENQEASGLPTIVRIVEIRDRKHHILMNYNEMKTKQLIEKMEREIRILEICQQWKATQQLFVTDNF
jgi:hypothetical protein